MKKRNRILALALTLVLLLCLCACGSSMKNASFEERMDYAQEQMSKLDSVHADMIMDVELEMSVLGQSQSMNMTMSYAMDTDNKSGITRMEINITVMGTTQKILSYSETVDGELTTYTSVDNGRSWEKLTAEAGSPVTLDSAQAAELFARNAGSFTKTGTETINGSQATVYSGELDEKYFEEVIQMTGVSSALEETLGVEGAGDMFSGLGSIPLTIAIDDNSGMMVRCTMDMTNAMQAMMKNVFDLAMESSGLGSIEIEIEIPKAIATMTLSQFNSVGEIVIPDEARGA